MSRTIVLLSVLAAIALIIIVGAVLYQKFSEHLKEKKEYAIFEEWDGECHSVNPETGAVCTRVDPHEEWHYIITDNGKYYKW